MGSSNDSDEDSEIFYCGSTKDVTSGDKFSFLTEEESEKAKRKRLRGRQQSDPEGPIGTLFEEDGKP